MAHLPTARTVAAATVITAVVAATACGDDPDAPAHEFVSRPDLSPPLIDVTVTPAGAISGETADDDLILLAPKSDGTPLQGLLIVDAAGEPVWMQELETRSFNLTAQEYRGEPVLTWWRGEPRGGHSAGEFVIMDTSYQEIGAVTTRGEGADHHDMKLTDDGTALLLTYPTVEADLAPLGGPRDGCVFDGVVQEVDVETGEVLFDWRALDHVPISQTKSTLRVEDDDHGSCNDPFDYLHINSVDEAPDGSLIVSARNTHAVYRIDRASGDVEWTLGGSASDFHLLGNAYFAWQHDAQLHDDGTLTMFDNEATPKLGESRGLRLELDLRAWVARVVAEYPAPDDRLSSSQGNMQVRDNGNIFIGWGSEPFFSEYSSAGDLLLDARLSAGESYRAYRLPWTGTPSDPPDLVVVDGRDGPTAYVSWNGATEVASWRFLAGDDRDSVREVAVVERTGFETSAPIPDEPHVVVQALDAAGRVIGTAADSRP